MFLFLFLLLVSKPSFAEQNCDSAKSAGPAIELPDCKDLIFQKFSCNSYKTIDFGEEDKKALEPSLSFEKNKTELIKRILARRETIACVRDKLLSQKELSSASQASISAFQDVAGLTSIREVYPLAVDLAISQCMGGDIQNLIEESERSILVSKDLHAAEMQLEAIFFQAVKGYGNVFSAHWSTVTECESCPSSQAIAKIDINPLSSVDRQQVLKKLKTITFSIERGEDTFDPEIQLEGLSGLFSMNTPDPRGFRVTFSPGMLFYLANPKRALAARFFVLHEIAHIYTFGAVAPLYGGFKPYFSNESKTALSETIPACLYPEGEVKRLSSEDLADFLAANYLAMEKNKSEDLQSIQELFRTFCDLASATLSADRDSSEGHSEARKRLYYVVRQNKKMRDILSCKVRKRCDLHSQ